MNFVDPVVKVVKHIYRLKRGRQNAIEEENPQLQPGEPLVIYGNDGDTRLKIGDGEHPANELNLIGEKAGEFYENNPDALFEVGNGTDDENRSNAFTVYEDGRASIQTTPENDFDVVNKKYVDDISGGQQAEIQELEDFMNRPQGFATSQQGENADTALHNTQQLSQTVDNHIADKNNPHGVTKAQVGLGKVDNTSDIDKPISYPTQAALDSKQKEFAEVTSEGGDLTLTPDGSVEFNGKFRFTPDPYADPNDKDLINREILENYHDNTKADKSTVDNHINNKQNPHEVTKAQIGLGNVDNTSDLDKPISTATQAALDNKVDKVSGKGLSTNDFTNADKTKLDNLEPVIVDQTYDPTSENAQSGTAVAEAISTKQDNMGVEVTQNNLIFDKKPVFLDCAISDSDPFNDGDLTRKDYVDNADQNLQEQIDAIASSSDVVDVVGTYAELEIYDTTHLKNNDIVKVLQDETKEDAITYYRWVIINHVGSWDYIGSSGPYYTKSETDALLDEKQNTLTAGENITIENGVISAASGGTVDQHYDPTSENAQSGVAVAEALRTIPTGGVGEKTEERGEIFNILEAQALFTPVIDNNDLVKFNANVDEYARFEYTKGWSTITAGSYTFTMDCHIYSGTPVIQVGADETGDRLPQQENYVSTYDALNGKYIITFDLTSDFSGNLGARIGNFNTDGVFVCAHPKLIKEGSTDNILNEFNSDYYASSRTANKWNRRQVVNDGYECFVLSGYTALNIIEDIDGINNLKAGYLSHAEGKGTWATAKMAHAEGRSNNFECTLTSINFEENSLILEPKNYSDVSSIKKNAVLFIERSTDDGVFVYVESSAVSNGDGSYSVVVNDVSIEVRLPANVKVIMGGSTSSLAHTEGNFTNAVDLTATDLEDTADNKTRQHAEGSRTLAAGYAAHAEGEYTQALANHSHAGGEGTIADETGETAIGRYNDPQDGDLFEVGNGSNDNNRSNAFRVTQSGKAIAGTNTVDTDSDLTLATKKYVDDSSPATNILLNYIDWDVDVEGNCIITGLKSGVQTTDLVGSFIIPEEIEGHMVTKIGVNAFKNCYNITDIIIPNTVKVIDEAAFSGCRGITSIIIPDSVTSIGISAFDSCTSLTSITVPDSVTSIGSEAFYYCTGLTSITIPGSVTEIEVGAFSGCTGLTSVTIPDSVIWVDDGAFVNCTGLTSVTIGNSVTQIGSSAFSGCINLTSIIIPDSVTEIDYNAFNECDNITTIYYGGTETQWNSFSNHPTVVSGGTIHFNYRPAMIEDVLDYHDNTKQNVTDNTLNTNSKNIVPAINEVYAMALGSQTGIAYTDYKSMIDTFNILPADDFFVGKNIYIETVDVPDLWIESNDESSSVPYDIFSHLSDSEAPTFVANKYYEKVSNEYVVLTTEPANWSTDWTDYYFVDDDSFVSTLETNGYVQVGYYKLAKLETGKVDLENYYTKPQTDNLLAPKLTEPSSNLAVGKYFRIASIDANGHAVLECVDAPTAPMTVDANGNILIPNTNTSAADALGSVSIGDRIQNTRHYAVVIGYNAKCQSAWDGIAIGKNAVAVQSCIQIGEGTNSGGNGTLQIYNYQLLKANGTIPPERITTPQGAEWTDAQKNGIYNTNTIRKTTLDQVLVPNANYDLGSTAQVSLTLTLPTPTANDNYSCNDIYVAFKSGSTATTLSIVGTYEGDTSYLPSADSICELSFKYICGTWVLVTKETAISST